MFLREEIEKIHRLPNYSIEKYYLVQKVDDNSAFFINNEKLYFVVKSTNEEVRIIRTIYLDLYTHININPNQDESSFKNGYYDVLIYNGLINESMFESFYELCLMFSLGKYEMNFSDFFNALVKLFSMPKENESKNLIGFFGELFLIKEIYEKYHIVITDNWHNNIGSNDKYDFCFKNFSIEVKTTLDETMSFEIKHSQIFNDKLVFLALFNIQSDNSGYSISELWDYFNKNIDFSHNLKFWLKLHAERLKINEVDFNSKKFSIRKLTFYCNKDLDTIDKIPECISKIHYVYNFSNKKSYSLEQILSYEHFI